MGAPSLLSLMCLGLAVMSAASQNIAPPNTPGHTSETMINFTFYIQNVNYGDISQDDVRRIVYAMMSDAGGEMTQFATSNGSPCTRVYVEWKNANHDLIIIMFDQLMKNGIEMDGQKLSFGFEGCQGRMHHVDVEFYIKGMPLDDKLSDTFSIEYIRLKGAIGEYFSPLRAEMKAMHLKENFDCLSVFLQFEANEPMDMGLLGVMSNLKKSGMYVGDKVYQITTEPCMPNYDDKNECPAPTKNYLTTCNDTCGDDMPCQTGFKCCYNGCGKACVRVGYAMSIRGTVVIDMPWLLSLRDETSKDFADVGRSLMALIKEQFVDMLEAVDVHRYGPFYDQTIDNATKASVTLYFNDDYSNDQVFAAHHKLMRSVLPMGPKAYKIAMLRIGNDGRCGRTECHGVCKHLVSGGSYCSCNQGRLGQGCQVFDCRMDVSATVPDLTQNYCRGRGQCVKNEDHGEDEEGDDEHNGGGGGGMSSEEDFLVRVTGDSGSSKGSIMDWRAEPMYMCECQPPYFGESCSDQLCDWLINPCNNHGRCTGLVSSGEICSCDDGWGGLFCEENTPDPVMTECEQRRRMMEFVHAQVSGEMEMLDSMVIPMKTILQMMGSPYFEVPYCLPKDNAAAPGRFYSTCYYNSSRGERVHCQCVGFNGEPNHYFYFGEDDCRVFSGSPTEYSETVYLTNAKWDDDMADRTSTAYTDIFDQVESFMGSINGAVKHLELMPRGANCVEMALNIVVDRYLIGQLMEMLPGQSIMIDDKTASISMDPCKIEVDIHSCPPIAEDEFSICMFECDPEAVNPSCNEDQTCCPLACGGGRCLELGYLQKLTIAITLSIPYKDEYSNPGSMEYLVLMSQIQTQLEDLVSGTEIPGYLYADVVTVKNSSYGMNGGDDMINFGDRKKRQALSMDTTIVLVLAFDKEIDVDIMMDLKDRMMTTDFNINGEVYSVLDVTAGDQGYCGRQGCHQSALCVDQIGGEKKCVCPKGRFGPGCRQTKCIDEDGSSMCANGGVCEKATWLRGSSQCSCQDGYSGEFCDVDSCQYWKTDACNAGKCAFSKKPMRICECPKENGGLFCELNTPDNFTACEYQSRMMNYVMDTLIRAIPNDKLTVPMSEFMKISGMTERTLSVPTCWNHTDGHHGEHKYICQHDMSSGNRIGDCMCVSSGINPTHYIWKDGDCIVHTMNVTSRCDNNPCYYNATCEPLGNLDYDCHCPMGTEGKNCERKKEERCPNYMPPLHSDDGSMRSCRGQACPFGFQCNNMNNNHSYCCMNERFLCDLDLCQNGARCMGDIYSGRMCNCSDTKGGLFCEKDYDGVKLTNCQIKQRFYAWVMGLLRQNQPMPMGVALADLRKLLTYLEMDYFMEDICDDKGDFKSLVKAFKITDFSETKNVCLDDEGEVDVLCKVEVCNQLQTDVFKFCQNGGRCVGDGTRGLCNCRGTGYHGVACEKAGEEKEQASDCTLAQMHADFVLGIMNGSVQLESGVDASGKLKEVFALFYTEAIFKPDCDEYQRFTGRGCAHMLNQSNEVWCYCSDMWGHPVTDQYSKDVVPDHCPIDGDSHSGGDGDGNEEDKCPREWGPDCMKPDWWCSNHTKCERGYKCYSPVPCDEYGCHVNHTHEQCVPVEIELPCEPKPCPHNPRERCVPCGEHGECFHVRRVKGNGTMRGDKDDKKDKDDDKYKDDDKKDDHDDKYKEDDKRDDRDDDDDDDKGMIMKDDDHFMCRCPSGLSGKYCEVRDEVCDYIPSDLCTHGCVGDLDNGILCRCPKGLSGLLCNKPAHSKCRTEKVFFDDVISILNGEMQDSKYNTQMYRNLVRDLTITFTDSHYIPIRKCAPDGLYDKLQCNFDVKTKAQANCYCADHRGEYVSSNVQPYINYPLCTGPADFREMGWQVCRSPDGPELCMNGGDCVFDLYNGKMCECKDGFHGLFCQHTTQDAEDEPISFCHYLEDSFLTAQKIMRQEDIAWLNIPNYQMYLNLTWMMIGTENRNIKGRTREYTGMKVECNADGTFKPHICDRDLATNEVLACYCSGFKGPLIGTESPDEESLKCDWSKMACHEREDRCPNLRCEHGHRMDLHMCETCECKRPCEGMTCMKDERCVVKHYCRDGSRGRCDEKAVCMPKRKSGMCPGHDVSNHASIIGGGLNQKDRGQGGDMKGQYPDMDGMPNKPKGGDDDKGKGDKPGKDEDMGKGDNRGKPGKDDDDDDDDDMKGLDDMEGMQCKIECVDDADCDGDEKCCGLCGNMCVKPLKPDNCADAVDLAMGKLELILATQSDILANMSRSLYMTVFHLSKTEEIWIPTCQDIAYKPVQCKYSIAQMRDNDERVPTECFCVDMAGHHIKGSMADGPDDQYSCLEKPLSCPAPNPKPIGPDADECQGDMECARSDKCCSDGTRKVCIKPVDPAKSLSTVDMMMQNLCQLAPNTCADGSTCTGRWATEGRSCDCPVGRKGPFCEVDMVIIGKNMTVCERKRFALERFNESIAEYRRASMVGQDLEPHQLVGVLEVLGKIIDSWDVEERDHKYAKMSMIYYKCDAEGQFYTMQCSLNMHSGMKEFCFCVNRQGQELLGTRKHIKNGMPYCGGKEPECKMGHPLRDGNGEITTCGPMNKCTGSGYECVRGIYGELHCCPNGHDMDMCMLTSDVGFECDGVEEPATTTPVTHYAYSRSDEACKPFEYRGCGGNRNRFATMEDCENRCVHKIHFGECPANFKITKNSNCEDKCASDTDCPNDRFKCCQSTCGKHCVPSYSSMPKEGMCPFGHNSSMACMDDEDCDVEGHYCYFQNDYSEVGTCCVDVNAVNLCHVKPWVAMRKGKDSGSMDSDDKYDDNDSEMKGGKYDDNDSEMKGGKYDDNDSEMKGGKYDDNDSEMKGGKYDDNDSEMKGGKYDDNDSEMKGGKYDDNDSEMKGGKYGDSDSMDSDDWDDDNDSAVKDMIRKGMKCEKKERFFYNPDSGMCQEMTVCNDMEFNSFESMEDCCDLCGSGTRCKGGSCPKPKAEPTFGMSCKNECRSDSECKGSRICCHNGCAMSCRLPAVPYDKETALSKCQEAQIEARSAMNAMDSDQCAINYVPSCDQRSKMFSRHQCQMSLGMCWCVTDNGHYIPDTLTRGPAHCDDVTDFEMGMADEKPIDMSTIDFEVCPNKEDVHCCKPALCMKKCRAHPEAVCRVNPCGGCEAEFFDAMGNKVDCDEGLSKCGKELKDASNVIMEARITAYNSRKLEEADEGMDIGDVKQYIDDIEQNRVYRKDIPMRCQVMPSSGNCKGFVKRWFYHPETRQCSMFIWGMCGGNENRFRSPEECYSVCDPESNPCRGTTCDRSDHKCKLVYAPECYHQEGLCQVEGICALEPDAHTVHGIFVPKCMSSGNYNYKQCHGPYCWCVNGQGGYNGGLTLAQSHSDLTCLQNGPSQDSATNILKCPDGSNPRAKCMKQCNNKVCPGHPKATCEVDLCSDKCATKFIDETTSEEVKCEKDECKVFRFDRDEADDKCKSDVLCKGADVKTCPSDVCDGAKNTQCPKNPCAVCMVDPCTCDPYFVDVTTRKRLTDKQCNYVTKGACHLKTCNMLREMDEAKRGGIEVTQIDMPECTKNGRFEPKQCSSPSDCHCVGEDGSRISGVTPGGKCKAIKQTKKVETTLSFKGDFKKMKQQGKLKKFKDNVLKMFMEKYGIPREMIKIGEPYEGSIKVDVEIVSVEDGSDLGVVTSTLQQAIDSGTMTVDVDGEVLSVDQNGSTVAPLTEVEVEEEEDDDDDDGLSKKETIIIAAACGAVGMALLILIAYCCCCKERKKQSPVDDTFTHERQVKPTATENVYDTPNMTFQNKGYMTDQDHYMKVRM